MKKNQIVAEWLVQLNPTGKDKNIFNRDVLLGNFQTDLKIRSLTVPGINLLLVRSSYI
ncbi:MAG: hypothetical protein AB7V16_10405 [Vulcanibacillus sp.]